MKKINSPKVSIILLNWNQEEDTIECLESLKKIEYPNYDIVLVDNGSTDGSRRVVKDKFPQVHLIENDRNFGFSEGNNVGMRFALKNGADYVFLLNNDTVVSKNILKELINVLENNSSIGIAGPVIYRYDHPKKVSSLGIGGKISLIRGTTLDYKNYEKIIEGDTRVQEVDFVSGCAMIIRKEVLEKVGLFDPTYFIYFEDTDLCYQTKKAGYTLAIVLGAKIWHKVSKAFGYMSSRTFYFFTRNRIKFVFKNAMPHEKLAFLIYFFLGYTPLFLGYCIIHRKLNLIKAFIKGIAWHIHGGIIKYEDTE
jgi:GT2 family glycosyltransferase